ncbi:MAG: hypothetical protein M3069_17225 [Chloroflexota bacterium]|nr:hypothetical protein [Chloroflexota bacterium]
MSSITRRFIVWPRLGWGRAGVLLMVVLGATPTAGAADTSIYVYGAGLPIVPNRRGTRAPKAG